MLLCAYIIYGGMRKRRGSGKRDRVKGGGIETKRDLLALEDYQFLTLL